MSLIKLSLTKIYDQNKGILTITGPDGQSTSGEFSLPWTGDEWPVIYKILASDQTGQTDLSKDEIVIATTLGICDTKGRLLDGYLQELGHQLYRSVFEKKEPQSLFEELILNRQDVIEFHVPDEGSYLLSYPWEALNDGKFFLFLTRHHILRWIDFEEPVSYQDVQDKQPLVLVIDPRPGSLPINESLPRTDFRIISSILKNQVLDQYRNLVDNSSTLSTVDTILSYEQKTISILHIDTHGDFGWLCACGVLNTDSDKICLSCGILRSNRLDAQGYLLFQDDNRQEEWVSGERLGRQLDGKNISLVVLNTCKSGTIGGNSAFNSIAGALIKYNIQVVIGFQTRISIQDAEIFTERFYRELVLTGSPVEAVTLARQALDSNSPGGCWTKPVLYYRLRSSENIGTRLFRTDSWMEQDRGSVELHHAPLRDTWLREIGFKLDPFRRWRGNEDENITKYFLKFPADKFFDVRSNEQIFIILGENGTGKSSLRKALSLFVTKEDAGLPVTYDDLHKLDVSSISLEQHASRLISHLFSSLHDYFQESPLGSGENLGLNLEERNCLWAYINAYLNDRMKKNWYRMRLSPVVENTPLVEVKSNVIDDFKESCRYIKQFMEFSTIWLLVDPDEDQFKDDNHFWKVLWPLLVGYRDLTDSMSISVCMRFFLPEKFKAKLYDISWFRKVGSQCLVDLKWDKKNLTDLLRTRILNCSYGRYESMGQISDDIQADEKIARASYNKPRYLIWICDEIFRQHCANEEQARRRNITQAEIDKSIENKRSEIEKLEQHLKTEAERLVQDGESQVLELKSTMRWDLKAGRRNTEMDKEVSQTIAAFLNAEGGTLIIGVGDHGEAIGVDHDLKTLNREKRDEGGFKDAFIDGILRNLLDLKPETIIEIAKTMSFENYKGKKVFIAKIKRSDKEIFVNDEFYIRQGSISQKLGVPEALNYIREHFDKT